MEANDIPLKLMPLVPGTNTEDQAEYKLLYPSLPQDSGDLNNSAL